MQAQQLDILEQNITFAIDEIQKEKRQYINKHVQNSLNNYFLENYCVLSLKNCFQIQSGRQIKNAIQEKYSTTTHFKNINLTFSQEQQVSLKKYYLLMLGFLEEHMINGSLDEYRESMVRIIQEDSDNSCKELQSSSISHIKWISPYDLYGNDKDKLKQWAQLQWKKLIALFILHHTYYPHIEAIYQIWFDIFQSRIVNASTQKKKKPENNRPYKYHDLSYIINNNYHSQIPLNLTANPEYSQKYKQESQNLLLTCHSFTSEILQSRQMTNRTFDENLKTNKKSKYYKLQKFTEKEDSSFSQNKIEDIQSKNEVPLLEKQPYKKIKKQQQQLHKTENGQAHIDGKQSVQNINQINQSKNTKQIISSAAQDYQTKFPTSQIFLKINKKEELSSLSKGVQTQSAFQKYNKTNQANKVKQQNALQTQKNENNHWSDSNDNNTEHNKNKLESNDNKAEYNTNTDTVTKFSQNMSVDEQNNQSNFTNDSKQQNQFQNKYEKIEYSETNDNQQDLDQNKSETNTNNFKNLHSDSLSQNNQLVQTFQYPSMTHIAQPMTLQQQPVQIVYQFMPQQQITPIIQQQQQIYPMMNGYQIQYVPMVYPNNYMNGLKTTHVALTQQFPVYNIKHY